MFYLRMKKLLFILFMVLETIGYSQSVKFMIGSSTPTISNSNNLFTTGNGQLAYSIGLAKDFKIKGKFYLSPEVLFSSSNITYQQTYKLTNSSGGGYDYNYVYPTIKTKGVEMPILLKLKGKVCYLSTGVSPYINNYKFNTFLNISTGVYIRKFSMDVRYSKGLNALDYNYKLERFTIGLSYSIGN